jgi:hypothetical protein
MVAFPQSLFPIARQAHCSLTTSIRLNFRFARYSDTISPARMVTTEIIWFITADTAGRLLPILDE